ncbi:fatty acid synthase-like, partial [Pseudomyrmex gracilis]|uniref:fatty acid synthase-like n=1 Tax=Pseudomyrmex gracilis TaxID=219809 RepID=UPI0009952418
MNTKEILQALRQLQISGHTGVYLADKLPRVWTKWTAIVANTDNHNQPGTHWVAFFLDGNRHAIYFDSYGIPPSDSRFLLRLRRNSATHTWNTTQLQGYFSQMRVAEYVHSSAKFFLANKISSWLNVSGPSYVVDTACSSSLFALAHAYTRIKNGECNAAIVAGVNLCLHPYITYQFFSLGVLSADGYCRPFDEKASGYMRSDTVAVLLLQKAKDARRIYATCVNVKTNCDGFKEEGITYPSFEMQKALLEEFYEECKIAPSEISYMEAHGTGTIVGDPVEVKAIDQVFCKNRNNPLLMSSIKSNLGHSEPASGLCQIAKVLIAMETGKIPATLHFKSPRNDLTAVIEGRIKIVNELTPWNGGYAGVNSFGFGGANCHVLLKSNPKNKIKKLDELPRLVIVSGRTKEAVKTILDD